MKFIFHCIIPLCIKIFYFLHFYSCGFLPKNHQKREFFHLYISISSGVRSDFHGSRVRRHSEKICYKIQFILFCLFYYQEGLLLSWMEQIQYTEIRTCFFEHCLDLRKVGWCVFPTCFHFFVYRAGSLTCYFSFFFCTNFFFALNFELVMLMLSCC